jgi:hypothetical protein
MHNPVEVVHAALFRHSVEDGSFASLECKPGLLLQALVDGMPDLTVRCPRLGAIGPDHADNAAAQLALVFVDELLVPTDFNLVCDAHAFSFLVISSFRLMISCN